jgi:competence ComEA-like helix-hairpin-helix protein
VAELADRVDLSSASAEDLCRLSGVGPALAERVVAWREDHGGFRSVDDLAQVKGIGERKLAALRSQVVARAPAPSSFPPPRRFVRPAPAPAPPPRRFVRNPAPAPAPAPAALLEPPPAPAEEPAAAEAPPPRPPAPALEPAAARIPPAPQAEEPSPAHAIDHETRLDRFLVTLAVASQVLVLLLVLWVIL